MSEPAIQTTAEALKKLHELKDEGYGSVYRGYSGRGMFGKCCIGFVTNSPDDVIAKSGMTGARRDSLGLKHIVYWPKFEDKE